MIGMQNLDSIKIPSKIQFARGKVVIMSDTSLRDYRESLGSNAVFHGVDKDTLTRRYAIMRRVWQLNPEELSWITGSFLRKTTGEEFTKLINTSHDWKDRLEFNNKLYDIEFIDTSLDWIEEHKKEKLIVSARENSNHNFYCILVKRIIGNFDGIERVRDL